MNYLCAAFLILYAVAPRRSPAIEGIPTACHQSGVCSSPSAGASPPSCIPPAAKERTTPPDQDHATTPAPSAKRTTFIIGAGDAVSVVARRYGIERSDIEQCNPSVRLNKVDVGDALVLPLPPGTPSDPLQLRKEIRRGLRGRGQIALTFDLGADVGALPELLDILQARHVHASFFVAGRWVSHFPDAIKRISDSGHEIFNHTYTHRPLPELSNEEILREMARTDEVIFQTTGRHTRPYYRPAYGDRDRRVLNVLAREGWQCVYWTYDSLDGVNPPKTAPRTVARVLRPSGVPDVKYFLDGAIVLLHAAQKPTADAMPEIIDGCRAMGLEPVPLTTLLNPETSRGGDTAGGREVLQAP